MATTMAATRQPFAPLNGSRLQNLTSLKNRQNSVTTLSSPIKRKASTFASDYDYDELDIENLEPIHLLSPKKFKSPDGSSVSPQKPSNFFLAKAPPSPTDLATLKASTTPRRPILPARSPAPRLNTKLSSSTPLTAPAGRSPTRKRIGILNRRKTASPFQRVDPPKFATSSSNSLGFSIDAAISGTISHGKPKARENELPIPVLHHEQKKDSWFFEIYEDTEEELATNLMEHGACTLDISSDEETSARMRDERGKENVPPMDDISQTRTTISNEVEATETSMAELKARARRRRDVNECDIDRNPLGNLNAEEFYAEGCDEKSVFIIDPEADSADAEHGEAPEDLEAVAEPVSMTFDFITEVKGKGKEIDVETLMAKDNFAVAPKASLLEPIEKAEQGFEIWASGSDKGDD